MGETITIFGEEKKKSALADLVAYDPDSGPEATSEHGTMYDKKHGQFADVVMFQNAHYDPHGGQDGDICHYRSISSGNGNFGGPHPDYIDVNKRGRVIRSWNEWPRK